MLKTLLTILCLHIAVTLRAQVLISPQDSTINQLPETVTPPDTPPADTAAAAAISQAKKSRDKNPSGIVPAVDLRALDGLFLGIGYKYVRPDSSERAHSILQKVALLKNLNSEAVQAKYQGEWLSLFRSTDLIINAFADIKGNIINYFGRGNNTYFDQSTDFRRFYRVKFSLFQIDPAFRFNLSKSTSIAVGPSLQHFTFDPGDNNNRYINSPQIIREYDYLQQDKTHGGLALTFNVDKRDDVLLPTKGLFFSVRLHGYAGLNQYSGSYTQAFPSLSVYTALNKNRSWVLANRMGAGFTAGAPEFYQQAFLGSQDNLLGYRKFRFAGDHLWYNNLETRITLLNLEGKRVSGKFGLLGFYDVGKVWTFQRMPGNLHHGYGGGLFVSPMNRFVARAVAGFSSERMQLTAAISQRF
ncbi:BamA/TamA family outer membrane protein [Pedobacter sp. SYSU D00535]|uniref:BamA/TamA family outer membrane protein n=1 Tax=Pedobacter sp. SYSU D00535 TaxID=2810308 RepID=UPI001A971843|nr:BamA/TamA family outer membrane protein [Pedobacter sp. SYSU D00535]